MPRRQPVASLRAVGVALVGGLLLASGLAAAEPNGSPPPGATVFPKETDWSRRVVTLWPITRSAIPKQ